MPGEVYMLQTFGYGATPIRDEIGNIIEEWYDLQELKGIIQMPSVYRDIVRGQEEILDYIGYFKANFTIPIDDLGKYRIKHTIPTTPEQTQLYQILRIDRNLRLKHKQHHIMMHLGVNKKWLS